MALATTASSVAPAVTMALLSRPVKKPRHCAQRSTKCLTVGANVSRGGTAKMSALGLNDDTRMKAIGTSDHVRIKATAATLPMPTATRSGRIGHHLPAQTPDIARTQQQRDQDHQPSRRGGGAEGAEAERVEVEIHGQDLGRARRSALRHQPDLEKEAERENVAKEHRHQERRHQQ